MATKRDSERVTKFTNTIAVEERLSAAINVLLNMRYEADGKGLFAQVVDGAPLLVEPRLLPTDATQDQTIAWTAKRKAFFEQNEKFSNLAHSYKDMIDNEVYYVLVATQGTGVNATLNARDFYVGFKKAYVTLCTADIAKITAKLRKPFVPGNSLTMHAIEKLRMREQLEVGVAPIPQDIQIADFRMTLEAIDTWDDHTRTLNDIMKESENDRLARPAAAFNTYVRHIIDADRNKRFGKHSGDPGKSTSDTGVPHDKVDVSTTKLDMVKEDPMDRMFKLLESVLVSKTGGGAAPRSRSKPAFTKRAVDAAREKHKDCDINDGCPVHPGHGTHGPGHKWGACSYYTGKEFIPKGKKN
jgi:hypothetical protein